MGKKTWYITGASRGFGRAWAAAALRRGDAVAAAVRDPSAVAGLVAEFGKAVLPLGLDVTNRTASFEALEAARAHFGRIDVVVNNAGYGHFGFVEELSEADARAQLETNFFGALWTTQAAIAVFRAQGGGHLLQVSSLGGVVAFPNLSIYHASKWALEGLTEALAAEVAMFGIRTTLIEPGGFATDWAGASARHSTPLPQYQPLRDAMAAQASGMRLPRADDTVAALLSIVDVAEPPARVLLGSFAQDLAVRRCEQRIADWKRWALVARSADGSAQRQHP
jgi:NAD(P)-dependent dehydrogenase (short-subunit alcohol dehydrogenase family)